MGIFQSRESVVARAEGGGASSSVDDADGVWMIVGLGNPGNKYKGHRHNVGFMAVDRIAEKHVIETNRLQMNCQVGRGEILGSRVLLAKPMTFMNNSGEGVSKLAKYYKVRCSDCFFFGSTRYRYLFSCVILCRYHRNA